ncbi:hypothetical protein LV89_00036 [Arcicella aurantiaca]|uniref:Lipocalin-like protein n=1 Tax=Arcicella aurantiaca TaxID=591202 RepID=A0A316EI23_9BACT|nr:hypothetical protein [Arcicella aurantiaca]PWK29198.1 hypothetical protein LV89_00036 [Arcicella aurantiaca]
MKNLSIILAMVILGFVSSCKKDETTTPAKTKTELITAKVWIINEVIALGTPVYTKGGTDVLNLGFAKVSLSFKSDGSVSGFDNNGKTLPISAKWSLSTDETKIIISGSGITGLDGEALIIQLTDTNFEVKGKVTYQGITGDANLKMIPQ